MDKYAIRFDQPSESVKEWLKNAGGHISFIEGGSDNPHIHVLLYSAKSLAALRKDIQRKFGHLGNGGYSITVVRDLDKYERYICKGAGSGQLPCLFSKHLVDYDEEWIQTRHEKYYEIQEAESCQRTVLEEVEHQCRQENVEWDDRLVICKKYIKELVKRRKCINNFAVKGGVNLIQCSLCQTEEAVNALAFEILR